MIPQLLESMSFTSTTLWIEVFFSLIIILICGIIYFRTKELYELTSYNAIRYFRDAFLFFGIAFLLRLLLRLVSIFTPGSIDIVLFWIGVIISALAGLIAGFYLIYSSMWKWLGKKHRWMLQSWIVALVAILILVIFKGFTMLIMLALFITAIFVEYSRRKDVKGIGKMHIIYLLLFLSWAASWAGQFAIRFSMIGVFHYIFSTIMFLTILHRVLKSTKKVQNGQKAQDRSRA